MAPSVWERATTAEEEDPDATVVLDDIHHAADPTAGAPKRGVLMNRGPYELLCLPEGTDLSPAEIWRAYHRLSILLQPDRHPQALTPSVQSLLVSVQEAFQTLIEPHRRVAYHLSNHCSPTGPEALELAPYVSDGGNYEDELREAYLNLAAGEIVSSTDLGLRLDASPAFRSSGAGAERGWQAPSPVDLQLCQSKTMALPTLGREVQRLVTSADKFISTRLLKDKGPHSKIHCASPTITVTGGAHGFLDEPYRLVSVLTDRYQPPGPAIHGPRHLEQLIASRFLPVLNVNIRQEFAIDDRSGRRGGIIQSTVWDTEVAVLPEPAVTTRIAHAVDMPGGGHPLGVEVSVTKYGPASKSAPVVGLALHKQTASGGTGFLILDAGDWTLRPAEECLHFSKFSTLTKRFANTRNPFRSAPTVEVGYAVSSHDLGLRSGGLLTKPSNRGVRAMDLTMIDGPSGSWTVSVGATAETVAGYLRYGRDILSTLSPAENAVLPPGNRSHRKGGFRAEIELGSSQQWLSGPYTNFLALRALKKIGRFTKVGFEVGVSPSNLHLSLYWSRLGQRINIPFLLATKSSISTELVFWATVLPFLGFGMAEIYSRSQARRQQKAVKEQDSVKKLQEYVARRRAEADELTVVLANGVEPRQRIERQAGGLVILSAKYSVKGAPSDEVADVTVAVAALVDGGELYIPKALRKSHLLGFWDPAPLDIKVLSVRYSYRGKEYFTEVTGSQELRLPRVGDKGN